MFRKTPKVLARCPHVFRRPGLATASGRAREYSDRPMPWQMDKMTDIGTRKIFNEDHDILRESVRKFWQSVPRDDVVKWEEQGFVDKEFWKEVGAQGQESTDTLLIDFNNSNP